MEDSDYTNLLLMEFYLLVLDGLQQQENVHKIQVKFLFFQEHLSLYILIFQNY